MSCFIKSKVPRFTQWHHEGLEIVRFVPIGAVGSVELVEVIDGRPMLTIDWEANMIVVTSKDASGTLTAVNEMTWSDVGVNVEEKNVEAHEVEFDSTEFYKFQEELKRTRRRSKK